MTDTAHGNKDESRKSPLLIVMRTASEHRRSGVARALLAHLVAEARRRRYARLSLETGSQPAFEPARRLYHGFGFEYCPPFGSYVDDPHSVFMTLRL